MQLETTQEPGPIPATAGVGLRAPHYRDVLTDPGTVAWVEVHPENYMGDGGPPHRYLGAVRERLPLSLHGVGLSLAGYERPDREHLRRLKRLIDRYRPALFSEHLAWTACGGHYFNDLLPLPYDETTLTRVVEHVDEVQTTLGRRMLLENPATYLRFDDDALAETEFIAAIASRSGCALLLDVNNVYVSATNHGYDARRYIDHFPLAEVGEIHVAGHSHDRDRDGRSVLIDSHDRPVDDAVWSLLAHALSRTGPRPVLVEWDGRLPAWSELLAQSARARKIIDSLELASPAERAHAG